MALFRKKATPAPTPTPAPMATPAPKEASPPLWPDWDIVPVINAVRECAGHLDGRELDPELLQARWADHHRDCQLEPPTAASFEFLGSLDADARRRLGVAIELFDQPELRASLPLITAEAGADDLIQRLHSMAVETNALTLNMLRQEAIRAQEFARHLSFYLHLGVRGETAGQSERRRRTLDYKRLLREAELAKLGAQEKMDALRKLQEKDPRNARRGKW